MAKTPRDLPLPLTPRTGDVPLHRWLYDELRRAILEQRLPPGSRLPATRMLARQHAIGRTTVVAVFEQLAAEGYLTSRVGSGTVVTPRLPDHLVSASPRIRNSRASTDVAEEPPRNVAASVRRPPFAACEPAADVFPLATWSRLIGRRLRRSGTVLLDRTDIRGCAALREAIAAHLSTARSVRCTAEQVVIVTGTQQALDLTVRLLVRPGDPVWMEEPGYSGGHDVLRAARARIVPLPVDTQGIRLPANQARRRMPALVYLTPAHHFPLGATLALERRLALLDTAHRGDFHIFEDDYDGEFRYDVRPLGSLQGQDRHGSVIYCGSFNKLLFAGLRLGYVVLPPALMPRFLALREAAERWLPTLEQTVLADFIVEGHLVHHLRRARAACLARRDGLLAAASRHLPPDLLKLEPTDAGFHLIGRLGRGLTDTEAVTRARAHRVNLVPLSPMYVGTPATDQVLLGFAAHSPAVLQAAVHRLAAALA